MPRAVDFEGERRSCLQQARLFVDDQFPADAKSLYPRRPPKNTEFSWTRAPELASTSKFVVDNIREFDVRCGRLGNSAFASALSVLSQFRGLFYRAVPADQGLDADHNYAGIFHFRFWWAGEWVEVVVDDRLPVVSGQLAFTSGGAHMWPALLEKAYAKLHGSYEALQYATVDELLSELSGGVCEQVGLASGSNLLNTVVAALRSQTLVTAVARDRTRAGSSGGVIGGRPYTITAVDKVQSNQAGVTVTLLRFRQTPGGPLYSGPWASPTAGKWLTVDVQPSHLDAADAGAFWMTAAEAEKHFERLAIVHFDADTCQSEPKLKHAEALYTRAAQGAWLKGATAGGCRNNIDTFHINPQFVLSVTESTSVLVALLQHRASQPHVAGVSIYQSTAGQTTQRADRAFFAGHKAVHHSVFSNQRMLVTRVQLGQGTYLVVPSTFDVGQQASFTIKLYANAPLSFAIIDHTPCVTKPPLVKAASSQDEYSKMFESFADERGRVSAYELQELLHACLPNDYIKSSASLDVCRSIMHALHCAAHSIDYEQFNDFIHSLKVWQEMFGAYSKTTSGVMKAEHTRDALADVGFVLSTDVVQLLLERHMRPDGTLRFGDFVACILHLIAAFNTFNRKDTTKSGVIKLNTAEWMKCVLRC